MKDSGRSIGGLSHGWKKSEIVKPQPQQRPKPGFVEPGQLVESRQWFLVTERLVHTLTGGIAHPKPQRPRALGWKQWRRIESGRADGPRDAALESSAVKQLIKAGE
jgi:hypothetical protein